MNYNSLEVTERIVEEYLEIFGNRVRVGLESKRLTARTLPVFQITEGCRHVVVRRAIANINRALREKATNTHSDMLYIHAADFYYDARWAFPELGSADSDAQLFSVNVCKSENIEFIFDAAELSPLARHVLTRIFGSLSSLSGSREEMPSMANSLFSDLFFYEDRACFFSADTLEEIESVYRELDTFSEKHLNGKTKFVYQNVGHENPFSPETFTFEGKITKIK